MTAVIDASVAVSFVLPDERSPISDIARRTIIDNGASAPSIFWYDVRNVFLNSERRRRIDAANADEALKQLSALPIALTVVESTDVIALGREHRLSAYDASYLALARSLRVPLLTFDKALGNAARREGLPLLIG